MIEAQFIGPYVGSNIVAVALVATAIKWPRLSRVLFVLIFLAASLFNIYTALTRPEDYHAYGDMAVLEFYRRFIHGFFSVHTQWIVIAIALGQMSVAALLSCSGKLLKLGVTGGIIFFVAIAPLGMGSAFPSTLLLAAALILMLHRLNQEQLKRSIFR